LHTGPLFIVALSAVMLGERVSVRSAFAAACGFVGVLLIVQPFAAAFSPIVLLPIAAAFLYAMAAILTRLRCHSASAVVMAFWLNLGLLVLGGVASLVIRAGVGPAVDYPFLFGPWQMLGWSDWLVVLALAILMIGIGIGLARAYQSPRLQVIAAFDYAYLIFAALWGYVFFGEVPTALTVLGMVLIAGAGLVVNAMSGRAQSKVAQTG
jgi:drug/metabolite transporter (DMT)-like permease